MAKKIKVDNSALPNRAKEIRSIRAKDDQTMADLKNLVLSLSESWKGEAQDAFLLKFLSMSTTFTQFSAVLGQYADLIDKSNTVFTNRDAEAKRMISSIR